MNNQFSEKDKQDEEEARRIAGLIVSYLRGTLTPEEHNELDEWVAGGDGNMRLFEELTDEKNLEENLRKLQAFKAGQAYERVSAEIRKEETRPVKRNLGFMVAALVLVLAGIVTAIIYYTRSDPGKKQVVTDVSQTDIGPGTKQAILILNNGKQVRLNAGADSSFTELNNAILRKQKDGLHYEIQNTNSEETLFNTLITPRGGEYQVVLADGTRVWLNAESSLKYSVSFNENDRKVELNGEAYFEVAG